MENYLEENNKNEEIDLFNELINSGTLSNYANINNFFNLKSSQKIIYLGIDCTGKSLHFGHIFLIFQSFRFIRRNFKVFFILGNATSLVGDPSDKDKERDLISDSEIDFNLKCISKQLKSIFFDNLSNFNDFLSPLSTFYDDTEFLKKIYKILEINYLGSVKEQWGKFLTYLLPSDDFYNYCQIFNNGDWLNNISFVSFVKKVGKNISLNYLLSKDWVKKRKDSGISYLSFNYSLLQAYDFLYLYENYNCHGQIGGSDQWGNLTTGLKLIKSTFSDNKTFSFNFSLLTDDNGRKISKTSSSSSSVFLNDDKRKWYDYFNNMSDEKAREFLKKITFISDEKIKELLKLNVPSRMRIPQRILYELYSYLCYKKIFFLENKIIS